MNIKKRHGSLIMGFGLAATFASTATLQATTLFNSNGFEPTAGYTPASPLIGQPAAAAASQQFTGVIIDPYPDTVTNPAQPTASVQTYAATFPGGIATNPGNLQFAELAVSGVDTNRAAAFYPQANVAGVGTTFVPGPGSDVVDIIFSMSVTASVGEPFFGVVAYGSGGINDPIGYLGVDATNGTIEGGAEPSSYTATLGPTAFTSYELQLNYTTQSYTMYEATPGSSAFTNVIGSSPFLNSATDFSYAALETYDLGANDTVYSGDGLFDDYSVTAVPEPASISMGIGGLAVSGFGLRRRRRAGR